MARALLQLIPLRSCPDEGNDWSNHIHHPFTSSSPLHMRTANNSFRRGGFTLVEIMIVVAIIALLAAMAIPSFLRARKRSQATTTLNSLRVVDTAKEQYALETGKAGALTPLGTDLAVYVKKGTKLYSDLSANAPVDALGGTITINTLDVPPSVSTATKSALSDALGGITGTHEFFGAYR
jgi:prepilin-type N-terminal cleavage/methylation domain-containing protein